MSSNYTSPKCIVMRCPNLRDQGPFVGDLCKPCYNILTTGKIGPTSSFLGDLKKELDNLKTEVSKLEDKLIML